MRSAGGHTLVFRYLCGSVVASSLLLSCPSRISLETTDRFASPIVEADMCESSGDESDAAPALETPAKETLPTVEADVVGGAMSPRPEPVPGASL